MVSPFIIVSFPEQNSLTISARSFKSSTFTEHVVEMYLLGIRIPGFTVCFVKFWPEQNSKTVQAVRFHFGKHDIQYIKIFLRSRGDMSSSVLIFLHYILSVSLITLQTETCFTQTHKKLVL